MESINLAPRENRISQCRDVVSRGYQHILPASIRASVSRYVCGTANDKSMVNILRRVQLGRFSVTRHDATRHQPHLSSTYYPVCLYVFVSCVPTAKQKNTNTGGNFGLNGFALGF